MSELKIVIGDKSGKSYQKTLESPEPLLGRKIGDKIKGEVIGLTDYELEIRGGSDHCGFPMRKDVDAIRKKILTVSGIGVKMKEKGVRQRKRVAGNTVTEKTTQLNLKVLKEGKKKLEDIFGTKEATSEEKETKESPKKEPKQKVKTEEKEQPKTKVEEKPEPKKETLKKSKPQENKPKES